MNIEDYKCKKHGKVNINLIFNNNGSLRCRICNREARNQYIAKNRMEINKINRQRYKEDKRTIDLKCSFCKCIFKAFLKSYRTKARKERACCSKECSGKKGYMT